MQLKEKKKKWMRDLIIKMRKEIKAYGNSKIILLTNEDCKTYGEKNKPLEVGDIVEMDDLHRVATKEHKEELREANQDTGNLFAHSE